MRAHTTCVLGERWGRWGLRRPPRAADWLCRANLAHASQLQGVGCRLQPPPVCDEGLDVAGPRLRFWGLRGFCRGARAWCGWLLLVLVLVPLVHVARGGRNDYNVVCADQFANVARCSAVRTHSLGRWSSMCRKFVQ